MKPSAWIDRLFHRFDLLYGNRFIDGWKGIDIAEVKQCWYQELSKFDLETIGMALDKVGVHPPGLPEFIELCLKAKPFHASYAPALKAPKRADPDEPATVAARERFMAQLPRCGKNPPSYRWAHDLQARQAAGEKLKPAQLQALARFDQLTRSRATQDNEPQDERVET